MTTKIVYIDDELLVAYKDSNIPTVPLKSNSGASLLSELAKEYPEILSCHGKNEWEGGILHRLDTPTRGLVIAARNQESYDFLSKEQSEDRIVKTYRATVGKSYGALEGFPIFPYGDLMEMPAVVCSKFRSFGPKGSSVRPVTDNKRFQDGPIYKTEVRKDSDSSFLCTITKGFRHQIRCHLAWAGYPIVGDLRYGASDSPVFGLEAIALSFLHPTKGERIQISVD
ncbi:MAG: RNA pseudouridine synthase [Spirochaetales bacterium]|nr:RNA pseudouridine synthase [Spirochaetales bacterium]